MNVWVPPLRSADLPDLELGLGSSIPSVLLPISQMSHRVKNECFKT